MLGPARCVGLIVNSVNAFWFISTTMHNTTTFHHNKLHSPFSPGCSSARHSVYDNLNRAFLLQQLDMAEPRFDDEEPCHFTNTQLSTWARHYLKIIIVYAVNWKTDCRVLLLHITLKVSTVHKCCLFWKIIFMVIRREKVCMCQCSGARESICVRQLYSLLFRYNSNDQRSRKWSGIM